MKALVLCAGAGTRLRPLTHSQAKTILPIANRPVLFYIIDYLRRQGFGSIGVVISPGQPEVSAAAGDGSRWGINLTYITQEKPLGIADAIRCARDFIGHEPFLVYLGDNLFQQDLGPAVTRFLKGEASALLWLQEVADPHRFGVAVLDGERVTMVEEKPDTPRSNLAIIGLYLFREEIFEAIAWVRPDRRGEMQVTSAIANLIAGNHVVIGVRSHGWWRDVGSVEGLLDANRRVLQDLRGERPKDENATNCRISGQVLVGPGTTLADSVLVGPLIVGRDCRIVDAFIGPYTSVGDRVSLRRCSIEQSIILEGAQLEHLDKLLMNSVVGRNVLVRGFRAKVSTASLVLGDDSRINLGL